MAVHFALGYLNPECPTLFAQPNKKGILGPVGSGLEHVKPGLLVHALDDITVVRIVCLLKLKALKTLHT